MNIATAQTPLTLAAANFNNDSRQDFAYVTMSGAAVVMNEGATFSSPRTLTVDRGNLATIAAGDVNGDGRPDLLIAGIYDRGGGLPVQLGNGDGSFRPLRRQLGIESPIASMHLRDLDRRRQTGPAGGYVLRRDGNALLLR